MATPVQIAGAAKHLATHPKEYPSPEWADRRSVDIARMYGELIVAMQNTIDAVNRGFGAAQFTQDRTLRMIRNQIPPDIRKTFWDLPE